MNNRNTIQEELKSLNSSLAGQPVLPAYQVPDGFFEQLPEAILSRIRLMDETEDPASELAALSPVLASIPRQMPFEVPEGYFQSNLDVLPVLNHEESLSFGKSQQPYTIPDGYFDQLPQLVMKKVREQKPARVVSISRKWMRVAAAAMVAGIMTIAGINYFGGSREVPVDSPQWVTRKLQNVSDQALDEFVKATGANAGNTASRSKPKSAESRSMLKDVSDSELDAFLDQVPVEEELAIN